MATEVLVEYRIEDGQKLIAELVIEGFDVSVAFWALSSEEAIWSLYIGSASVNATNVGDAYRTLYRCLGNLSLPRVSLSDVKLLSANDPIAEDAISTRDRHRGRTVVRVHGGRMGSLSFDEAHIYPRIGEQMTPGEILQALIDLANRPWGAIARPSVITLRNGTTIDAVVTGFNLQMPGGLTIATLEPDSNIKRQISADEVVSIL